MGVTTDIVVGERKFKLQGFIWQSLVAKGSSLRIVLSTFLLVGKGLDMAQMCSFSFYLSLA